MANQAGQPGPGLFRSSICLDLLKDPVCFPCGHFYCSHLQPHHQPPAAEKPGLVEASGEHQENVCSHHDEVRDVTVADESKTGDKLEDIPEVGEGTNVSETVDRVDVSPPAPPAEPATRAEFLRYSCPITLDPNTVNRYLSLSEGNRKVTRMDRPQTYPHRPERFVGQCQVLSTEGLTGRRYWEAELSGVYVGIAVSYKDTSRAGGYHQSGFGSDHKSWSLQRLGDDVFRHRGFHTDIPGPVSSRVGVYLDHSAGPVSSRVGVYLDHSAGPVSSRVGVYLDHSAGTLSFYRVSDTMTLLHRVHTTFTRPLHAGFRFWGGGATAELCDLK